MTTKLRDVIKRVQANFHVRLFLLKQGIDRKREKETEVKAKAAKNEWNAYIREIIVWQNTCNVNTCSGCDRHRSRCCCGQDISLEELTFLIRRLAGINPVRGNPEIVLDENKSGGPIGYRICGKNSWDNTIRAHEEDQ